MIVEVAVQISSELVVLAIVRLVEWTARRFRERFSGERGPGEVVGFRVLVGGERGLTQLT